MMRIILASNNGHKAEEFAQILAPTGIEIIPQRDAGCLLEPEETGSSFQENAYIKAHAVMEATGLPAVADDSGLMVDALDGAPGVHSARYTGDHDDTDYNRRALLLRNMEGVEQRSARFVSAICCCFPNGDTLRSLGVCEGRIAPEMRGSNGFGYDPVFLPEGCDRTTAEMSAQEKNAISHRGKALRAFAEELRNYNADNN